MEALNQVSILFVETFYVLSYALENLNMNYDQTKIHHVNTNLVFNIINIFLQSILLFDEAV